MMTSQRIAPYADQPSLNDRHQPPSFSSMPTKGHELASRLIEAPVETTLENRLFFDSACNRSQRKKPTDSVKTSLFGQQTRVNVGRMAALPLNMAIYFALGTYSKSVGNAKKARESRLPMVAVPVSFVAGALTGGAQGAGCAVKDTVQIIRGKKSRRQALMMLV